MYHLSLLPLLALCITLVFSAPTTDQKIHKRSFKLSRRSNPSFTGRHGPRSLLQAYRKHNLPIPTDLYRSASIVAQNSSTKLEATSEDDGTGLVTATPVEPNDLEYIAPISIGGQEIPMNIDTGSADLWVFNTQLGKEMREGHTLYDPTLSKSFRILPGEEWNITYGDGSGAWGNVGTDVVNIGGVSITMAVEMATVVSSAFVRDTNSNGLVGLSFSQLNTVRPTQQRTFFDTIMDDLAEPVFTADLRQDEMGAYEFGRISQNRYQGELQWVPIDTSRGHWEFESTSFAITNDGQVKYGTTARTAIVDTGTTLMLVSEEMLREYYAKVEGAVNDVSVGGIVFPCSSKLPDLFVDVGGEMARVEGRFINFAKVDEERCFGGLQGSGASFMVFGDIFFKSQFVAFNGGNNSVGVAPHVEPINRKLGARELIRRMLGRCHGAGCLPKTG